MQGLSSFIDLPYLFVKNGIVIDVSEAFSEFSEYPIESLIQIPVSKLFKFIFRATCDLTKYIDILQGEVECHIFTKSLEAREVIISFKKFAEDNIILVNEKENSRLEKKFPLAEALYKKNITGLGIFCVNPEIILLKANQTFLDFFMDPYNQRESSIGKRIDEFVAGWRGSTSEVLWNNLLSSGEPFYSDEYEYKWPNGVSKYYKASLVPIFENDRIKYVIESTQDITNEVLYRKRIDELAEIIRLQEKKIIQSEKAKMDALVKALKMKNEFLSTITHEFKTPLAVIIAAIQTINNLYSNELSANVKKHIQSISTNTLRQLRLVNNLLDIARYNEAHLKLKKQNLDIVYLTKYISESVQPYASQKNIKIYFITDIISKIIAIDEEKYERILLNLLSNAIKFTNSDKSIHVHVSCTKESVIIKVKDEGVGIPKNKQKLIFERFEQVNSIRTSIAEGTGIGLSLVKSLVVAMGGNISVKSTINVGSEFIVSLPITLVKSKISSKTYKSCEDDNRIMKTIEIEFSDIYK